jgi:hypothetical protein
MLGRHVYRVSKVGGAWCVVKDGEPAARRELASRDEAVAIACALAKDDEPSRVTVENPDGTLEEERKFGVDPGQTVGGR